MFWCVILLQVIPDQVATPVSNISQTEKLTWSLKIFRTEGFRDKANMYESSQTSQGTIKARHKAEGQRIEEDNRDNTSALLELRDIEDELQILHQLFERQSKVISSMHSTYLRPEIRERTANGRGFLGEAAKRLGEYTHQTQEMVQRVRNTRSDYDKLLQMVQRQAQVDEVRLSRLHADLASAQSRSVMIFTTFTVIFLPLTFFTGLFGMNTREWGGGDYLPLRTIGLVSLPASVVLVAASLVLAWSTTARRAVNWVGQSYAAVWRGVVEGPVGKGVKMMVDKTRGGEAKGEERREAKAAKKAAAEGMGEEASDFWDRHRLERERGYRIPEKNRRGGEGGGGGRGSWRWGKGSSREERR